MASRAGVPLLAFAPNAAAAVLGAVLAGLAGRWPGTLRRRVALMAAGLALVAVGATLLCPGVQGVHRWLPLGPLWLNASAALAPVILAGVSVARGLRAAGLVLAAAALHLAQPDAGQQSALAVGVVLLLLSQEGPRALRLLLASGVALATAWTWSRPDPLAPVAHVEQIYQLGAASGPLWAVAVGLSVLTLVGPLGVGVARAWRARSPRAPLQVALLGYLVASLAVPLLGAFPVPVLGAGAGPVLGWYAALGLLGAASRADAAEV